MDTLDGGLLSERVYRLLRAAILRGDMAPGERLVESEIARQLGVSQAPVREAIQRLVHESLLTSLPRRGSYVTEISAEQVRQAREVRSVLEGFAAGAAAARRAEGYEGRLTAMVEAMHAAAQADDWMAFREADVGFHRLVCSASNNEFIPRMWAVMEPSLLSLRVVSDPALTDEWVALADEHSELLTLLLEGRVEDAVEAFRDHGTRPRVSPFS